MACTVQLIFDHKTLYRGALVPLAGDEPHLRGKKLIAWFFSYARGLFNLCRESPTRLTWPVTGFFSLCSAELAIDTQTFRRPGVTF